MDLNEIYKKNNELLIGNYYLRKINYDDINDIYNIFSDKEVMKYYDLYPHKTLEESKSLITNFIDNCNLGTMIRFGIIEVSTNRLIGTCGFHNFSKTNNKAEIGYDLNRDYWNKGIMTQVINKLVSIGMRELQLNRIEAFVEPENIGSRNVLKKCKFTEEGLLRQYEMCKGRYIDLYIYSILKYDLYK